MLKYFAAAVAMSTALSTSATGHWVSSAPDAPRSAYDPKLAMTLWWHSRTAYCPAREIANMTCPTCHYWEEGGRRLTDVTLFTNASRNSQAYVAIDHTDGISAPRVIVVHRGSSGLRNWVTNFKFWQTDYPGCELMAAGVPSQKEMFGGCKVHAGFMNEWRGFVHGGLLQHVGETVARLRRQRGGAPVEVLATGHSLGGAVALHAALAISHSVAGANVTLYSFGAPRVGNAAFARFAAWKLKAGQQAFRVTHGADPFTRLPIQWSFGFIYRQAPHEIHYNRNDADAENFVECKDVGDMKMSEPQSWWRGGLPVRRWFWTTSGGPDEDANTCLGRYAIPWNFIDHANYLGVRWDCTKRTDPYLSWPAVDPRAEAIEEERIKEAVVAENY